MATVLPAITPSPQEQSRTVPNTVPAYRRNGKLQSCEPCRKGKLRCDHVIPTCSRCARQGKAHLCIYHPAPLTKSRQASSSSNSNGTSPKPPSQQSDQCSRGPPQKRVRNTFSVRTPSSYGSGYGQTSLQTTRGRGERDGKTGAVGSLHYSNLFNDGPERLGIDAQETGLERQPLVPASPIPSDKVHTGAEILFLFVNLATYELFLSRWFEIADGITMIRPVYNIWVREIRTEFGKLLTTAKSVEDLYGLSEIVWRNTEKSIPLDGHTTATQWAMSGTGRSLRWETVGLIFSVIGTLAGSLSDWDPIFATTQSKGPDRQALVRKMRGVVERCVEFCRECECLNDPFVCLVFESSILMEMIRGDAFYGSWQRSGETCDLAVMMGMHLEKKVDASTPFFICQLRARIFEEIYGHDKALATFVGRPPRISYRYCSLQMPLDLTDEEMMLEGADLEAAVSRLQAGWNTSNRFTRVTWRRVWAKYARIREDILEIALGTSDDVSERAAQISLNLERCYEAMPDFVKVEPETVLAQIQSGAPTQINIPGWPSDRQPMNVLWLICIHCGMWQTHFLLKRALVNRGMADAKEMIAPARALLRLLLDVISKRDFLRDFQCDLVGLMSCHGLPSAGVMAVELLKQEQSKAFDPLVLPRSETIQDLSVFISALGTVGPGEGNYATCNQGRRALKRLLDKILSPDAPPQGRGSGVAAETAQSMQQQQSVAVTKAGEDTAVGAAVNIAGEGSMGSQQQQQPPLAGLDDINFSGLYFPTGNDAEFLRWLDDVEWESCPWLVPGLPA